MLEHQREGIAKAQAEGKYRGRQPTARRKAQGAEIRPLVAVRAWPRPKSRAGLASASPQCSAF